MTGLFTCSLYGDLIKLVVLMIYGQITVLIQRAHLEYKCIHIEFLIGLIINSNLMKGVLFHVNTGNVAVVILSTCIFEGHSIVLGRTWNKNPWITSPMPIWTDCPPSSLCKYFFNLWESNVLIDILLPLIGSMETWIWSMLPSTWQTCWCVFLGHFFTFISTWKTYKSSNARISI